MASPIGLLRLFDSAARVCRAPPFLLPRGEVLFLARRLSLMVHPKRELTCSPVTYLLLCFQTFSTVSHLTFPYLSSPRSDLCRGARAIVYVN